MKKITFIFLLLFCFSLFAQMDMQFWNNTRHSGYNLAYDMHIRCETMDMEAIRTEFWYRNDSPVWNSQEMELLDNLTYDATFPYSADNLNLCRFRTETDTIVIMMPAYMTENSLPNSEESLGFVAEDPAGDTASGEYDNLDITNSYFGYNEDKIFVGMQNVADDFPTNSGGVFPSSFFIYIAGLINLESVMQDSVMYGLVYANIPMVFESGLYKVSGGNFDLDSIQRIGDVDSNVVDGSLLLSCNIEDLTSDEDFGDWPISNSLGFQIITNSIDLNMQVGIEDMSKPSIQTFSQYFIEPFENILPVISEANAQIGVVNTTVNCNYYDENDNFPLIAELETHHENSELNQTYTLNPLTTDYTSDVQFMAEVPDVDWTEIVLKFSDNGEDIVQYIIDTASVNEELIPQKYYLSNYPNPFNPSTTISFNLTHNSDSVEINIYNLKGQLVKRLPINYYSTDTTENKAIWNGTDMDNKPVSSGVYLYKLNIEGKIKDTNKCLLLK